MGNDNYIIQSLDGGLSLLLHIAAHPDERLSDLARDMGITRPRMLRLLRTLEQRKMITRDAESRYRLGSGALVIGTAAVMQVDLVRLAGPVIEKLGAKVNETVQLRIHDNGEALCVAKFEPSRDLRVQAAVGRRRPLHAGSSKVLLAYMPSSVRQALIPEVLDAITTNTIRDRERLEAELAQIREQGFCISHGEVREHLCAVSVPVRAVGGSVVASLNVAAPAFRTQQSDLEHFKKILIEASARIAEGLGYRNETD